MAKSVAQRPSQSAPRPSRRNLLLALPAVAVGEAMTGSSPLALDVRDPDDAAQWRESEHVRRFYQAARF